MIPASRSRESSRVRPYPQLPNLSFGETAPQNGQLGYYTITNNSTNWWISGFDVSNPLAGDPYEPTTTQTDWTAGVCDNCFDVPGFSYSDGIPSDFVNYIGPDGGTSSNFFFGAPPDSRIVIDLVDNLGQTYQLVLGTPEPSTWLMMVLGFAGLGFATRLGWHKGTPRLTGAQRG